MAADEYNKGSVLSANAKAFIPASVNRLRNAPSGNSTVPSYILNCYPFVGAQNISGQLWPPVVSNGYVTTPMWPVPVGLSGPPVPQFFQDSTQPLGGSSVRPLLYNKPPPAFPTYVPLIREPQPYASSARSTLPEGKNAITETQTKTEFNSSSSRRSRRRTKLRTHNTIAIQTDFPESLANKTLEELMCPLYKGNKSLVEGQDSDSGYCSPMRHQTNSSTQPSSHKTVQGPRAISVVQLKPSIPEVPDITSDAFPELSHATCHATVEPKVDMDMSTRSYSSVLTAAPILDSRFWSNDNKSLNSVEMAWDRQKSRERAKSALVQETGRPSDSRRKVTDIRRINGQSRDQTGKGSDRMVKEDLLEEEKKSNDERLGYQKVAWTDRRSADRSKELNWRTRAVSENNANGQQVVQERSQIKKEQQCNNTERSRSNSRPKKELQRSNSRPKEELNRTNSRPNDQPHRSNSRPKELQRSNSRPKEELNRSNSRPNDQPHRSNSRQKEELNRSSIRPNQWPGSGGSPKWNMHSHRPGTSMPNNGAVALLDSQPTTSAIDTQDGKPKKKSNRTRKNRTRSRSSQDPGNQVAAGMSTPVQGPIIPTPTLHFEDEDEFPNLLSAMNRVADSLHPGGLGVFKYSDILKRQRQASPHQKGDASENSNEEFYLEPEPDGKSSARSSSVNKNLRKRERRLAFVTDAADKELAEISLEQEVLRELSGQKRQQQQGDSSYKPKAVKAGKLTNKPVTLNFADMVTALEKQNKSKKKQQQANAKKKKEVLNDKSLNLLDSNAPKKRGKEREHPKPKKHSSLKKVILKEREERKRLRLLEEGVIQAPIDSTEYPQKETEEGKDDCVEQADTVLQAKGPESSLEAAIHAHSIEDSPISQQSPIMLTPLSGSPMHTGHNSPIVGPYGERSTMQISVLSRIHSRRFREYCNQMLDRDIDACCTELLQDLVRFQDRAFHKDPVKFKLKRRLVLGLREVSKHLKLKKIKLVVISPNLERIQAKGGLDDVLSKVITLCSEQSIPFVFALGRRALGRACGKLVPVSVVGVFNYESCEDKFRRLMELSEKARSAYDEMVLLMEQEMAAVKASEFNIQSNPGDVQSSMTATADFMSTKPFAHMGHSRTPSACSAISFCSSVLSEPISENYPLLVEPEVEEHVLGSVEGWIQKGKPEVDMLAAHLCLGTLVDIDEGHEADTEEDSIRLSCASNARRSAEFLWHSDGGKDCLALPPFDSIHDSTVDQTVRGVDRHSIDVQSTHSSHTLEGSAVADHSTTLVTEGLGDLEEEEAENPEVHRAQRLDSSRIECWVADSQKRIEELQIESDTATEDEEYLTTEERDIDDEVSDAVAESMNRSVDEQQTAVNDTSHI